jgi:hypothetical protein
MRRSRTALAAVASSKVAASSAIAALRRRLSDDEKNPAINGIIGNGPTVSGLI